MAPTPRPRRRIAAVLGLIVLSPIAAEYLIGYDDIIGQPMTLLVGLLIFGPLYGCAAVLIRELTRRAGRGWPTMLLLSLAAGLVQAGLIDQSLFNPDYRDIPYWQDMRQPTYLPWIGTSAYLIMNFLIGHMVRSFAVPIAVVESLVGGEDARRPRLGRFGLILVGLGYVGGAAFIMYDQRTLGFTPSPGQLIGTGVVVVALVVAAFVGPGRDPVPDRAVPPVWAIGILGGLAWAGTSSHPRRGSGSGSTSWCWPRWPSRWRGGRAALPGDSGMCWRCALRSSWSRRSWRS